MFTVTPMANVPGLNAPPGFGVRTLDNGMEG